MVNRLTQIYTKTGDQGKTGLGDGTRIEKSSTRIECLGGVDELNSIIGVILTEDIPQKTVLKKIQHDLFDIGGELSIPNYKKIDIKKISFLEQELDNMNGSLSPLKDFILPGGSKAASYAHLARAVCRRVERSLFLLNKKEEVNNYSLKYFNRLSDFLFVLARYINEEKKCEDILWQKNI
ncbi:MAG: cob(I)yrinic acid a,c-diamide adenosyltransferase [Nitrosomonadales bacterium]|jgi:cob(I)alamin adenosyltransferase|nr:cob(I)yrinic acid a,c-diamide adenosyltransferase [Nitrosomonadales bacterium]MBT4571698.1 cob(I)yrinic acid a,c-diamide adenosyltransferase [Nitrosomonadales bacterium]MBT5573295.1 cob(I)yrinic acid a,c-diamide adenosyltransferase [Nitrosomonadales bacterium]MBT6014879.1 cob(I)yrinic acid a,c-diamide adenosyltransferase [Nitrosomonadales bacterium]MBT6818740.1 cob(I)yrinic acid a,c-diamide adenosyltransferase [Nitrosomonadales bacterium]